MATKGGLLSPHCTFSWVWHSTLPNFEPSKRVQRCLETGETTKSLEYGRVTFPCQRYSPPSYNDHHDDPATHAAETRCIDQAGSGSFNANFFQSNRLGHVIISIIFGIIFIVMHNHVTLIIIMFHSNFACTSSTAHHSVFTIPWIKSRLRKNKRYQLRKQ